MLFLDAKIAIIIKLHISQNVLVAQQDIIYRKHIIRAPSVQKKFQDVNIVIWMKT